MDQNWHLEGCWMPQDAIGLDEPSAGEHRPELIMAGLKSFCRGPHLESARFSQLCPLRRKLSYYHQKDSKPHPGHLAYVHPHAHAQDQGGPPRVKQKQSPRAVFLVHFNGAIQRRFTYTNFGIDIWINFECTQHHDCLLECDSREKRPICVTLLLITFKCPVAQALNYV